MFVGKQRKKVWRVLQKRKKLQNLLKSTLFSLTRKEENNKHIFGAGDRLPINLIPAHQG